MNEGSYGNVRVNTLTHSVETHCTAAEMTAGMSMCWKRYDSLNNTALLQ